MLITSSIFHYPIKIFCLLIGMLIFLLSGCLVKTIDEEETSLSMLYDLNLNRWAKVSDSPYSYNFEISFTPSLVNRYYFEVNIEKEIGIHIRLDSTLSPTDTSWNFPIYRIDAQFETLKGLIHYKYDSVLVSGNYTVFGNLMVRNADTLFFGTRIEYDSLFGFPKVLEKIQGNNVTTHTISNINLM